MSLSQGSEERNGSSTTRPWAVSGHLIFVKEWSAEEGFLLEAKEVKKIKKISFYFRLFRNCWVL